MSYPQDADAYLRRRAKRRPQGKKPELVAEVEFRAWTADEKLRHASYKGLREAADADDVYVL